MQTLIVSLGKCGVCHAPSLAKLLFLFAIDTCIVGRSLQTVDNQDIQTFIHKF